MTGYDDDLVTDFDSLRARAIRVVSERQALKERNEMKSKRIRALLDEPDEFGGRDEAQRKLHELRQERDDWGARCDRAVLAQDAAWKKRDEAQRNYAVAETRLAEYEREQDEAHDHAKSVAERDEARAKLARYEEVVSAALKWRAADLDRRRPPHEGRPLLDALADTCDALRDFDLVRRLLEDAGCSCDCEHAYGEHDNTCARCLGCRVAAAIAEDQA